jgi:hypothetical protein
MSTRGWVDYFLPDVLTMHADWLRDLVRGDNNLLAQVARSPTARRLLTRKAYKRYEIPVPSRSSLAANQQWLLSDPRQQAALARRLGLEASQELVRTTVDARSVAALRRALGEDGYRAAMTGPGLRVEGLQRATFIEALQAGKLTEHLVAIGAALLETTTRESDSFARLRMRFAFSPACWRARPRGLRVDEGQLARRLEGKTGETVKS